MNVYPAYLKVCSAAAVNDKIFQSFRKKEAYHTVVEGVPVELGKQHADYIKEKYPFLLSYIDKFATNDNIGQPIKYYYSTFNRYISSVTVRYIKILGDLISLFGSLEKMDVVEIGAGYGGQCKIIYDYCKPKSYTIIDLPEANKLSAKFLKKFGITDIIFKTPDDILNDQYSLCISNYAFAEFDRAYQDMYAEKIIKKSERGYMICNFFGKYIIKEHPNRLTREEIEKLKPTGKILKEDPISIEGNFLYVWDLI
jgi:putative sugar O-methyltransferase